MHMQLYAWHYGLPGPDKPEVVLKARRTLRAVHFHPLQAPSILVAEVCPAALPVHVGLPAAVSVLEGLLQGSL